MYGSASGLLTYCTERGITPPSSDTAVLNAKILRASEWLDAVYRTSFPGLKVGGRDQEREWPRSGVVDTYGYAVPSTSVPNEIIYATYEAAFDTENLSVNYTPPKYKAAAVSGAVSVTYATFGSVREMQTKFAKVDEWLSGLIATRDSNGGGLVGSVTRV